MFLKQMCKFLMVLLSFAPVVVFSLEIPKGVTVLTAPEVREMVGENKTPLIHTLSAIEFQMQHIPDSINIPVNEVKSSPLMPKDKNASVIFYCNGYACPYSQRASKAAIAMGYSNVHWFRGGILEWRKFQYPMIVDKDMSKIKVKKLSPQKFLKAVTDDVVVLDVRPKWWRQSKEQAGVIEGTEMMIPLLKLDKRLHLLPRDKPILISDRLMRQSVHAAKYLIKNGFNVKGVLKGGSKRWVAEGLPVMNKQDEPMIAGDI